MIQRIRNDTPHIEYPCRWTYRIIGNSEDAIRSQICFLLSGVDHEVAPSHVSRSGKYLSLKLSLIVRDEAERRGLYRDLCRNSAVRYVL